MTTPNTLAPINTHDRKPDLRHSLGWRLSPHAKARAASRGITIQEVLEVVVGCEAQYPGRANRTVLCRGSVIAVVDLLHRTVVTTYRVPAISVA